MNSQRCSKTIIFSANTTWYLYNFRFPLIKALLDAGHRIIAVSPRDSYEKYLLEYGIEHFHVRMKRGSINPVDDIILLHKFSRMYANLKPDIVQHFTAKPVIYGTAAARMVGVKHIFNMIPGLGYVFTERSFKKTMVRFLVSMMYRKTLQYSSHLYFQNTDDRDYFINHRIVKNTNISVVPGTGVDVHYFSPSRKQKHKTTIYLVMARMLWEKGIGEFVEAARVLRKKHKETAFWIIGPVDTDNPMGIPFEQLNKWNEEGVVHYHGMTDDVKSFMEKADVIVLPSYYREGIPLSLLEAAAMGMPIITTDSVGCRDVVENGKNGFLVPPKDPKALADAMEQFVLRPGTASKMGEQSRRRALEKFDSRKIVAQILKYYPIERLPE